MHLPKRICKKERKISLPISKGGKRTKCPWVKHGERNNNSGIGEIGIRGEKRGIKREKWSLEEGKSGQSPKEKPMLSVGQR